MMVGDVKVDLDRWQGMNTVNANKSCLFMVVNPSVDKDFWVLKPSHGAERGATTDFS